MNRNARWKEVFQKTGIRRIDNMPKYFMPTFVLGVRNGHHITVADMLKVIEYAIRFIKANFDVDQKKYAETLKFLKASKALFENKRTKASKKETLHFVVDVFHEMEDMNAVNDEQKKVNEEIALVLDLLIEMYAQE